MTGVQTCALPIQHASDRILGLMNRDSTNKSLCDTLSRLRKSIPDIHVRTTLIVGFPGENEDDFATLFDFVEEQKFSRLGVFTYSKEEGTIAAEMDGQISDDVKKRRLDTIMERQMEISLESNREKVGSIFQVLIDSVEEDGTCMGRTEFDAPEIDNSVIFVPNKPHRPGDMARVEILEAFDYDLEGREV